MSAEPRGRSVLRQRDVGLIASAVGLSALGDWLALVPLALHLQEQSGSGLVLSGLLIALWAPVVVLAGPAGLIVDRLETRRVLLVVSLGQAAVAAGLAFADGTVLILALTTLLGVGFAVAQPAEFALVPAVAREERLTEVNGHVETARFAGMALGPVLGGLLSAVGGMQLALLLNALTFVAVAAAAGVLRARRAPVVRDESAPPDRARDGIVFLAREAVLAVVVGVSFVSLLFMTASAPAEVFFARDFLDAGDFGYGLLMASWMCGMAIGALVVARRVGRASLALGALVAIVVQSAGLAVPTLWLVLAFAIGFYFVGGVAHGTKNVLIRTLIHERVPDRLRGRTFAAYNGVRNGAELVALLGGGVLVSTIGARWTLLLAGAVPAAVGLLALAPARRRLAKVG